MVDKIAIMNRARLKKRRDRDLLVEQEAIKLFSKYKHDLMFISGVVLYWAEGTRLSKNYRKYQLAFTNSDPALVSFYREFLKKYFSNILTEEWRAGLFLYKDINIQQATSFWSNILGVSQEQFIKTQILPSNGKQMKKLKSGTCCLYVNSKDACITMQAWIDCIRNNAAVIQR